MKRHTATFFTLLIGLLFCCTFIQAQSNQYLHFDGSDDYVALEAASQYLVGADGVSMTGWFYSDALIYGSGMMGIRGGGDGAGQMYLIQLAGGVIESRFLSTGGFHEVVAPAGTIVAQTWQHVAWVYNGSSIELFIDGVSVGSAPASGTFASTNRPFGIGKSIEPGFNFVFTGRVDEVTLWSKGLTQAEIQDMMANELVGDEPNLEAYYKCNQGLPGGTNTSITQLVSEVEPGARNADLFNFQLVGNTSNFDGVLEGNFQAISFPEVPHKLITDAPFELEAIASSGLPVSYELISGPATLVGNVVTLMGTTGEVIIKASQAGDGVYDAAEDVITSFLVLDPAQQVANIDIRNPIEGNVYLPVLGPIHLAAIVNIDYTELFDVTEVEFQIDQEMITVRDWQNQHYTGWWTPPAYGTYTFDVIATNNFGTAHTVSVDFEVVSSATDLNVAAFTDVWVDAGNGVMEAEGILPSYQGAFDQIMGTLDIGCPPGGCDPWDRVSSVEARGHNGEWYEIIRYLTPYGVACDHQIDLTDFESILQGKIRFRVNLGTQGNGFLYSLNLDYQQGTPFTRYSSIQKLWSQTYPFGDPANLQPCETFTVNFDDNTLLANLKLVSSGHGWGENNTGNAAEFHADTHHIWVNGVETFSQYNWQTCDPNPDDCSPQAGTWYFPRAGWCPGSIAQFFDFDMTLFTIQDDVELQYIFNEAYTDFCHPNNPDCITGVTCANCNDGFNPHLIVSSYLISKGNAPLEAANTATGIADQVLENLTFTIQPNPSAGQFRVVLPEYLPTAKITVFNAMGQQIEATLTKNTTHSYDVDLKDVPKGIYLIQVTSEKGMGAKKIVVE